MDGSYITIQELETIIKNIENTLYLPNKIELDATDSGDVYKVIYAIVRSPLQLNCGCTISNDMRLQYFENDNVFDYLQQKSITKDDNVIKDEDFFSAKNINLIKMNFDNNRDVCPICFRTTDIKNAKPIKSLGQLYNQLAFLKKKYLNYANNSLQNFEKYDYDKFLKKAVKLRKKNIDKLFNKIYEIEDNNSNLLSKQTESKTKTLLQLFESVSLTIKEEKSKELESTNIINNKIITNGSDITESLKSQENNLHTEKQSLENGSTTSQNKFALSVPIISYVDKTKDKQDENPSEKSSSHISETLQKASNVFFNYTSAFTEKKSNNEIQKVTEDDENKEINYVKCFPMYRRRSHYSVYSKLFPTKSKLFINNDISKDCTKFVLLSEHKWEVYNILEGKIGTGKSNEQPFVMNCCGKINGDYGLSFNSLIKNTDTKSITPDDSFKLTKSDGTNLKKFQINNDGGKVRVWDHLFCKVMNNFLVIAGTKGILRIIDLNQGGKIVKTLKYSFPIRCIDVDSSRNVVACGITGKDRTSGAEQALIVFQRIIINKESSNSTEPEYNLLAPITITLPYRDPINTLQFSDDGFYMSCTTCFENRFLVISVKKIEEPRLIMKSIRNIDNSLESEGITSTNMFPGNAGLMCVTSVAYNSPPIIIETKIKSNKKKSYDGNMSLSSNNEGKVNGYKNEVLQPSMLLRLDELGSKIYKAEISPRNDSIVFLDRNGTLFLLASSSNNFVENNEKRRILILDNVSNAYKLKESASMRFSKNGHKLFIVDRKGIFYIEDFSAGLPTDNFVTQCKQLN
ncbi:related to SPS-sensor component PTR3 [Hanseniaspora guilliermondii]|uniref:Related to SPS-sensor component PTR3 n=1 Tax=Hanseniaspora guilliermondii TaxID=56406 RepID=A0A1L0CKI4_9ASCO|nr:related to SPS-sensor component PTR3 [Hanseniaspora guilliermondii]